MLGSTLEAQPFLYLTAFLLSIALCWSLSPLATKLKLVDVPGGRKVHEQATPTHGGIAIYLAVGCTLLFLQQQDVTLTLGLMGILAFVLVIGALDDAVEIPAKQRLVLQTLCALALIGATGTTITSLGNLFWMKNIQLGFMAVPFTVFCYLAGVNAINMLDGADGLAGSIISVILGCLALLFYLSGNLFCFTISIVTLAATLGFLALNFRFRKNRRAKLFMGDSGSMFLGFLVVWLTIQATQGSNAVMPPAFALSLLAVPLLDSGAVLFNRLRSGRSPFSPGRDHVHHFLQSLSLEPSQICLVLAAGCATILGLAMYFVQFSSGETMLVTSFAVSVIGYAQFLNRNNHHTHAQGNVFDIRIKYLLRKQKKDEQRNAA